MRLSFVFCSLTLLAVDLVDGCRKDHLDKEPKDPMMRQHIVKMLEDLMASDTGFIEGTTGIGLKSTKVTTDKAGSKLVRIQQEYHNLPVFGYHIIIRETPATSNPELDRETGKATGKMIHMKEEKKMRGMFFYDFEKDIEKIDKTKFNPEEALEKLKVRNGTEVVDERAESVIFIDEQTAKAQVAYKVSFVNEGEHPSVPTALYGMDGNLIEEWDNLQGQGQYVVKKGTGPGGNRKIGGYTYGKDKEKLLVQPLGNGICEYVTDKVVVVDLQGSWNYQYYNKPFRYYCFNQASDRINGGYSPLNDVNYFAHGVFSMYQKWYSTTPVRNLPMSFKVHVGQGYENAQYNPQGNYMLFGDGGYNFHPMTGLGILAHEMSHGFTDQHAGLIYQGQSGGLNEAFSDMAAKASERFLRGYNNSQGFHWSIGFDIVKRQNGVLRCMDNPPCDGRSIDNINQYYQGLNVHHSSGLFNKVFYLIAIHSKNNVKDAFDLFYTANTNFWRPRTGFLEAAEGTLEAMHEMKRCLHHSSCYDWLQMNTVVDAFNQVGIRCSGNGNQWNCQA